MEHPPLELLSIKRQNSDRDSVSIYNEGNSLMFRFDQLDIWKCLNTAATTLVQSVCPRYQFKSATHFDGMLDVANYSSHQVIKSKRCQVVCCNVVIVAALYNVYTSMKVLWLWELQHAWICGNQGTLKLLFPLLIKHIYEAGCLILCSSYTSNTNRIWKNYISITHRSHITSM